MSNHLETLELAEKYNDLTDDERVAYINYLLDNHYLHSMKIFKIWEATK